MVLSDVIVAYYIPSLFGWLFLLFVIVVESTAYTYYLDKHYYKKSIFISVLVANIVTTIIGFFIFPHGYAGGSFLNWIPVSASKGRDFIDFGLFVFSFLLTIIVEAIVNVLVLRKMKENKRVIIGTLIINVLTYTVAAVILISYRAINF